MRLANDDCRCLGEKPGGICENRRQCERYEQRDDYGPMTPFARWLCGPGDTDYIIRAEEPQ